MIDDLIGAEIRPVTAPDGGLSFHLVVEGEVVARARAPAPVLQEIRETLGAEREAVERTLRQELVDLLKAQQSFVTIENVRESPEGSLRFAGRFTHGARGEISTGVVWYDVTKSKTWPTELPAVVRNKMRFEVHRSLTAAGSAARALVDLHG